MGSIIVGMYFTCKLSCIGRRRRNLVQELLICIGRKLEESISRVRYTLLRIECLRSWKN